ncbi:DUF1822 family protein [Planktothrix mougeotii]|uniref:DUF1822 family protein n=1 Tax=Planktothrix mougeotii LEGE 06226 TaxID=1828728 RepID=A0ABR9UJM3_9CYAN|nr:DUF1822 family protein [Planktothrix mougeotii]MBE9146652.1 DUF1822 family protein [Planktothrix mougeotii LEGE 06226]
MTYTNRSMFTVPLTSKAYKLAKSFQSQYENPTKAQQVYLNTLAVYAVETYCECLGIETDIENSDSLNPVMQPLMNIADLEIEGIGKIECRPVLPEDKFCYIPVDTWENRIGYIVVEIDESSREATLLGFYPPVNALEMIEYISLDSFLPLEALIDHINRIESALDFIKSDDPVVETVKTRLTERPLTAIITEFERIYRTFSKEKRPYAGGEFLASCVPAQGEMGWRGGNREEEFSNDKWQELAEELLNKLDKIWSEFIRLTDWLQPNQIQLNGDFVALESFLENLTENLFFRYATAPRSRRAETEDILESISGIRPFQLAEYPLALVLAYQVETEEQRTIIARLYSNGEDSYLPPDLKLTVLEDTEVVFLEATSRSADNWIQLQFHGEPGEHFSIKIELGDISIIENFMI